MTDEKELSKKNEETNKNLSNQGKKKESKIKVWIKKHKSVCFLIVVLIVVLLAAFIKIKVMERNFAKEKLRLHSCYEYQLDSIKTSQLVTISEVFSWAVRSELLRNNKEQINQFFLMLIKKPGFQKIQLIDPVSAKVILSTDKKEEGRTFKDAHRFIIPEAISFKKDSLLQIVTPITGLNDQMGILIIECN
jgi:hypothetical protein